MRTIAVVNQKGGCGKTITAINLAAFLALAGRRILLVDMDPQGHSTLGLSAAGLEFTRTLYDVLLSDTRRPRTSIPEITCPVAENFDLAPSDILLSAVPEALAGLAGREDVLARALAEVRDRYDYIIIDCPPNVGLLTFNALKASTEAVIPMDPSFFSLHGIGKLFETFDLLERQAGHRISARVLVTLYPGRSGFVQAVVDEVHRHLAGRHFETVVRHSVKLAEAASHGVPIARYARRSAGYEDYEALAREVMGQEPAVATTGTIGIATGPTVTPEGVVFTIEAPAARQVQIAGDFNDWCPERTEMEAVGPVWTRTLSLPPGRYRYRYVIDGEWRSDPRNLAGEPSPYGGEDSVLVLGEPQPEPEVLAESHAHGA